MVVVLIAGIPPPAIVTKCVVFEGCVVKVKELWL